MGIVGGDALLVFAGGLVHLQILLGAEAELTHVTWKRALLFVDEQLVTLKVLVLAESSSALTPIPLRWRAVYT